MMLLALKICQTWFPRRPTWKQTDCTQRDSAFSNVQNKLTSRNSQLFAASSETFNNFSSTKIRRKTCNYVWRHFNSKIMKHRAKEDLYRTQGQSDVSFIMCVKNRRPENSITQHKHGWPADVYALNVSCAKHWKIILKSAVADEMN